MLARPAQNRLLTQTIGFLLIVSGGVMVTTCGQSSLAGEPLQLTLRKRVIASDAAEGKTYQVVEQNVTWAPEKTAAIVCDMWDDHWCRGAAARVVEMTPPMNHLLDQLRKQGVLIIHAPSTCVDFYAETPQRRRAQQAPFARPPVPLSTASRWGTHWCWPDPDREPDLPIDDSDMGCDCEQPCEIRDAWTRQIAQLTIAKPDAISDNGQEVYNLLEQHQIENVMIMGVHLNMCVLGRPFGIRQLVKLNKNVALVRDLTDTMYNHRKRPFVNHFAGTDLVVEHVEKYWCPSFTSDQITGGQPFRFAADRPDPTR